MTKRVFTIVILATLLCSCREQEAEPMIAAGYITADSTQEALRIEGDTIGVRTYAITEHTTLTGGAMVEGNIAEVIYLPAEEEGELPQALTITTDKSYAKALGRWQTDAKAALPIDIELMVRGGIKQYQPQQTMQYTHWQLTGVEDEIVLHGTISLPAEVKERPLKTAKGEEEIAPPARRERRFSIKATITKISDSNTESRRVLVLSTEKGKESMLYYKE